MKITIGKIDTSSALTTYEISPVYERTQLDSPPDLIANGSGTTTFHYEYESAAFVEHEPLDAFVIYVNDEEAFRMRVPENSMEPLKGSIDLSKWLRPGQNKVQISSIDYYFAIHDWYWCTGTVRYSMQCNDEPIADLSSGFNNFPAALLEQWSCNDSSFLQSTTDLEFILDWSPEQTEVQPMPLLECAA